MTELTALARDYQRLAARLDDRPDWAALNRVYLDLAPLIGRLQGAANELAREHGDGRGMDGARAALDRLKATSRQVGHDIRLASPTALTIGLQTAVQAALETIECLERVEVEV